MSSSLRTILKTIALLLAVTLVIATPFALLAWDIGRVVFNPPLVKDILTDEVVNSDLIPVALEWFSESVAEERVESGEALTWIEEPDIVQLLSLLDRQDWRAIKKEVLPAEILAEWVSVTVDGTYAWIDSQDRVPKIVWDLQSFTNRVNSEHGINAIQIAYDNLDPCDDAQIADFKARLQSSPAGSDVLYNLCQFPNEYAGSQVSWYDDQISDYRNSLQAVVENVPPRFNLTEALAQTEDVEGAGPEENKQLLRNIRLWMSLAWLFIVIPLVLILLLAVRSLNDLARWWGAPLLVAGMLTLIPGLIYRWLITNTLASIPLSDVPPLILEEAMRSILRLADAAFRPMIFQAIVLLLVGLGLLIWIGVRSRQERTKAEPSDQG